MRDRFSIVHSRKMTMQHSSPLAIPPSGPWRGYYLYGHTGPHHHMQLQLTFTTDGTLSGDGTDDVGPFVIDGTFNIATREYGWTKSYVGRHRVEYRGLYDGRSICGDWSLPMMTGGF